MRECEDAMMEDTASRRGYSPTAAWDEGNMIQAQHTVENGTSPKTSSVINCLKRRWEEFTTKHGEAYEWSGTPTIDLAVHFQTHGYSERLIRSCTGETGMSDSWESLQVPYLLAKHVFTACGYAGWAGLRTHELQEKAKPYTVELRGNWDRLKKSVVRTQARLKVAASEA